MRRTGLTAALLAALFVTVSGQESGLRDLTWLAGDWEMTAGTRTIEEHWTTPSANVIVGMGRTVASGRTVSFEYLRIEQRKDGIFYVAHPNARAGTDFKLTRGGAGEVVFENPAHDDVRRIAYRRESESAIVARVEGVRNGQPFSEEYRYRRSIASK